jgi:hypothetical protein
MLGKQMLGGKIAINPDRFDKLITALRTAVDNDGILDKEAIVAVSILTMSVLDCCGRIIGLRYGFRFVSVSL